MFTGACKITGNGLAAGCHGYFTVKSTDIFAVYSLDTYLIFDTFQQLLSHTTDISKLIFWDQKVYFEISVV